MHDDHTWVDLQRFGAYDDDARPVGVEVQTQEMEEGQVNDEC